MRTLGVTNIARIDITEEIKNSYGNLGLEYNGYNYDAWVCCWHHIYTKDNIRLNRVLGLHKINKQWERQQENF